jgi:FkbM family methyltransferase
MKSYSQYYQDFFIDFLFNKKEGGVFLDIGANDGITFSNTYHFEKFRNWTGLCIEPHNEVFEKSKSIRNCFLENCCISNKETIVTFRKIIGNGNLDMLSGIVEFMSDEFKKRIDDVVKNNTNAGQYTDIKIFAYNINTLLEKYNLIAIDYCSIDTEGAEYEIVSSIDFEKYSITSFSIEGNNEKVSQYLQRKGYKCIKSELDNFYIKQDYKQLFAFTIVVRLYKLYWKIWRRLPKWLQKKWI